MTVGTCRLVLHSHLPWLAGHGSWPVGEEWLYHAWSQAYLPVVRMLERLAAEGRGDLLTLRVTPVLAAPLDDSYAIRQMHTWLSFWQVRAEELARRRDGHLASSPGTSSGAPRTPWPSSRTAGGTAPPARRRFTGRDATSAVGGGHVAGRADLPFGSWGAGKDFRAWSGEQVADLVESSTRVQHDLLAAVDGSLRPGDVRRPDLDGSPGRRCSHCRATGRSW